TEVRALVSASATGFYGDRGDTLLPETARRGQGFLADVCQEWEHAALTAEKYDVRVALPRFGFVIAAEGGAMDKLRPLFRCGLGGKLGSGKQWMPWVHVDDICGILIHLLENDALTGAFNAVAPKPVTNAEFTHALAAALHRPAVLRVPAFALRAALGEFADLALDSTRAIPEKALAAGYVFRQPDLAWALRQEPEAGESPGLTKTPE
ncbi:MAG: TIGR01777 family oxidoreductase, partial [Chthoniobacterales bacterium]